MMIVDLTKYHFRIEWRIQHLTERNTTVYVVLRDPKTIPIDVEYEIQHSHISLLVADRYGRFPAT